MVESSNRSTCSVCSRRGSVGAEFALAVDSVMAVAWTEPKELKKSTVPSLTVNTVQHLEFRGIRAFVLPERLLESPQFSVGQEMTFLPAVTFDLRADLVGGDGPEPGAKAGTRGKLGDAAKGENERVMRDLIHELGVVGRTVGNG